MKELFRQKEAIIVDNPITQDQSGKIFVKPSDSHVSLGSSIRTILFLVPFGIFALILYLLIGLKDNFGFFIGLMVAFSILTSVIVSGVRVAAQWERGIVLRLGKFQKVTDPGLLFINPFLDYVRFVDLRTLVINIPHQKVITKDNVPAQIDGVMFFTILDPEKSIMKIQDYRFAISQSAQASLRDVVGGLTLDELLAEREQIQKKIGNIVEEHIKEWGLHVDSIRLLDIELPEDLKKMMSRQASAEREKRATITKSEGDKLAAVNLAEAANLMQQQGAMHLRTLQTIDGLGTSDANTVILFPEELTRLAAKAGLLNTKEDKK
jgi:regulator of protease activity HflC (stomatin/prohibitin superfamily)